MQCLITQKQTKHTPYRSAVTYCQYDLAVAWSAQQSKFHILMMSCQCWQCFWHPRCCSISGLVTTRSRSQTTTWNGLQESIQRESQVQEQLHNCNASLSHLRREKDVISNSLKEKSLQLADLQREAADKKRAFDTECEKLSREKHKRQRVEEDNKVMRQLLLFVHASLAPALAILANTLATRASAPATRPMQLMCSNPLCLTLYAAKQIMSV